MQSHEHNTPPHENNYDDYDIEDADEVYEMDDEDDLEAFLEEAEAEANEEDEDMEGDNSSEEGDETFANPVVLSSHEGSVFCCALSPNGDLGVSGGEDDRAVVWDTESGATVFECPNHKDSVTCVCFSHDGRYLATGDMGGLIQVWEATPPEGGGGDTGGRGTRVWHFETDEDLNWMLWHPSSCVLLAGTVGGAVWMWLLPAGRSKALAHAGVAVETAAFTKDGRRLCAGFSDGSVRVLDLRSGDALHVLPRCHAGVVGSLATHADNALFITGSTDGTAKIINSNTGKEIATLSGGLSAEGGAVGGSCDHGVEAVSFCPTMPNLAVTASLSGIITIWDIPSKTSRHHIVQGCGTSSLSWHPSRPLLLSAGLDGSLRVLDVRSAEQVLRFKGHRDAILACDIAKDGGKVVTCSDDGSVRLLSTPTPLWDATPPKGATT